MKIIISLFILIVNCLLSMAQCRQSLGYSGLSVGDTIDISIDCDHKTDTIKVEWRTALNGRDEYFIKCFRLTNNLKQNVYLKNVRSGDSPHWGFNCGLLEPNQVEYSAVYMTITGRLTLMREMTYYFVFCPNTIEEETFQKKIFFIGKR